MNTQVTQPLTQATTTYHRRGPKPGVKKTPVLTYLTDTTNATFDQVVKQRGLSKTQAFEAAVLMWMASENE